MAFLAQAPRSRRRAGAHEARLVHAAGEGDGRAFAILIERYEQRVFDLAYRVTGSADRAAAITQDAFVAALRGLPQPANQEFGPHLFIAAREAAYDPIARPVSDHGDQMAPPAASGGGNPRSGGAGRSFEEDPEVRALLEARQHEIREANLRLPTPQREVLALRETEGVSYDEIAEIMDVDLGSVAELISAARLGLRDELRGATLTSAAAASRECQRARPSMAMRDDDQLDDEEEAAWLLEHLAHCAGCRLSLDAMQEADSSYREWAPVAVPPFLSEETMAKAAELMGGEWSEPAGGRIAGGDESGGANGRPAPAYADSNGTIGRRAGALRAARGRAGAFGLTALGAPRESVAAWAARLGHWVRNDPPGRKRLLLLGLAGVSAIALGGMLLAVLGNEEPGKGAGPPVAQRSAPDAERSAPAQKVRRKRKATRPRADRAANAVRERSVATSPATAVEPPGPTPRPEPDRKRPARRAPPAAKVPTPVPETTPQPTPPTPQPAPTVPPATPPAAPPPPQPAVCQDEAGQPVPC